MSELGKPGVVLNNGTQLGADIGQAGPDAVWLWIRDPADPYNDLVALGQLLADPAATCEMTRWYGSQVTTFTGFTRLSKIYLYDGHRAGARLERMVEEDGL